MNNIKSFKTTLAVNNLLYIYITISLKPKKICLKHFPITAYTIKIILVIKLCTPSCMFQNI